MKLIDFGIAKNVGDQHNVVQTMTGAAPGTPLYMSLNAKDSIFDVRSDIWALVASMLEMAICYVPPRLAAAAPVPVEELRQTGYSEKFIVFIDTALQKEPGHGFQTAAEALEELQKLVHEKTGQTTTKNQIRQLLEGQVQIQEGQTQIQEQLHEQGLVVARMVDNFADLEGSIEVLIRLNRAEFRLLEELVRDETCCPRLIWITPKPKVNGFEWLSSLATPSAWLYDTVLVSFVCPHGMHVVPCGPSGSGYEMQLTKKWV
jgi:serine/threonine protein kinase